MTYQFSKIIYLQIIGLIKDVEILKVKLSEVGSGTGTGSGTEAGSGEDSGDPNKHSESKNSVIKIDLCSDGVKIKEFSIDVKSVKTWAKLTKLIHNFAPVKKFILRRAERDELTMEIKFADTPPKTLVSHFLNKKYRRFHTQNTAGITIYIKKRGK
jgi:hypothetical protein